MISEDCLVGQISRSQLGFMFLRQLSIDHPRSRLLSIVSWYTLRERRTSESESMKTLRLMRLERFLVTSLLMKMWEPSMMSNLAGLTTTFVSSPLRRQLTSISLPISRDRACLQNSSQLVPSEVYLLPRAGSMKYPWCRMATGSPVSRMTHSSSLFLNMQWIISFLPAQSPPQMPITNVLQLSLTRFTFISWSLRRWRDFLLVLVDLGVVMDSAGCYMLSSIQILQFYKICITRPFNLPHSILPQVHFSRGTSYTSIYSYTCATCLMTSSFDQSNDQPDNYALIGCLTSISCLCSTSFQNYASSSFSSQLLSSIWSIGFSNCSNLSLMEHLRLSSFSVVAFEQRLDELRQKANELSSSSSISLSMGKLMMNASQLLSILNFISSSLYSSYHSAQNLSNSCPTRPICPMLLMFSWLLTVSLKLVRQRRIRAIEIAAIMGGMDSEELRKKEAASSMMRMERMSSKLRKRADEKFRQRAVGMRQLLILIIFEVQSCLLINPQRLSGQLIGNKLAFLSLLTMTIAQFSTLQL